MKIVIERSHNEKPIIRSAFIDKVEAGVLLVINLTTRSGYIESSYSQHGGGEFKRVGWSIGVDYDSYGDTLTDLETVNLIPENKREEKLLEALPYTLKNKDQIEILLVPWGKLATVKHLANTFDD